MDQWEKINTAQRMQDYIHRRLGGPIALEDIADAAGYSKWHSFRIFKEVFHKTPFEYIRALRLTNAARSIRSDAGANILDIALDTGFASHEGFTKAFHAYFGVNPGKYRAHNPRRYMYFDPSPVLRHYLLLNSEEHSEMKKTPRTVTVTVIEKSPRKLILKRGRTSADYFAYCAEMGCDAWEILETVPGALDKPVFLELPPGMVAPGTSRAACALEVPADFDGEIPEGFDVIDLSACHYLWFNGAPYEDESWFGHAHEELGRVIAGYRPEVCGYEFAPDLAPHFHYGTSAATGCREMLPVRRVG